MYPYDEDDEALYENDSLLPEDDENVIDDGPYSEWWDDGEFEDHDEDEDEFYP